MRPLRSGLASSTPTSALDRSAASEAVGRYGHDIDAAPANTYPGLLTAATDARSLATGAEAEALVQQQRENVEAITAESAAHTLRGDETHGDQGGDEDLDREGTAIAADGEAAEHRDHESQAGSEAERARDDKVTAQLTPNPTTTTTATKVARRPPARVRLYRSRPIPGPAGVAAKHPYAEDSAESWGGGFECADSFPY